MGMIRSKSPFFIVILLIFLIIGTFLIPTSPTPHSPAANTVPTLNIILGGITPEVIGSGDKSTKYPDNSLSINYGLHTEHYNDVTIKGHGNSTWLQDKKPYQIKFNQDVNLFNLGAAKKWLLLADHFDPSHLKNNLAFYLENLLHQTNSLEGQYVELYFNNEYQGLYYLTEKVEIGQNRINLNHPLGIIVEHEGLHANTETCHSSLIASCLIIKDTVNDAYAEQAMTSFLENFIVLESATIAQDYDQISKLADIDSFITYYLLSNFTLNPDAFMASYFFYQDGPNDQIHVGPGWDFDFAFSSAENQSAIYGINHIAPYNTNSHFLNDIVDKHHLSTDGSSESAIMYNLLKLPEFQAKVTETYASTIKGHLDDILNYLDSQVSIIRKYAIRDNTKWDLGDFDENAAKVRDWIKARYEFLTAYYDNLLPTDTTPTLAY